MTNFNIVVKRDVMSQKGHWYPIFAHVSTDDPTTVRFGLGLSNTGFRPDLYLFMVGTAFVKREEEIPTELAHPSEWKVAEERGLGRHGTVSCWIISRKHRPFESIGVSYEFECASKYVRSNKLVENYTLSETEVSIILRYEILRSLGKGETDELSRIDLDGWLGNQLSENEIVYERCGD